MSYSRSPSNNRLLALEQELLEKKRLAEERQSRQNITHIKKDKTRIADNQDLRICPLNPPCKTAKHLLIPPRIDTAGEFNIRKYWRRDKSFSSPPAPNSGGAWTQSPPELGDLGGIQQSCDITKYFASSIRIEGLGRQKDLLNKTPQIWGARGAKSTKLRKPCNKPQTNNRLLQLEQELLGRYSSKKLKKKTSGTQTSRVEQNNSDRVISHGNNRLLALEQELLGKQRKPKKQKPKSKRSRVKSQVFDTGEPIELQYNSEVFPVATPQTAAVSVPQEAWDVDKSEVEASEPELPVAPPQVVSKPQISEEISQESENSLSQAAEFISEIEPTSNYLQAEDIPAILAEVHTDRAETPAIPVAPQEESRSDREVALRERNNPHAIFDRMGKNIAYATAFDMGTIELEQLFDEFDRTLELQEQVNEKQVNKGDSVSQGLSNRNLELEQRFDELDRTLDQQEQVNGGDSVSQRLSNRNLELEQRFDEFDRTLKLEEQVKEFKELRSPDLGTNGHSPLQEFTNPITPATSINSETSITSPTSETSATPATPATSETSATPATPATSITPANSPLLTTKLDPNTSPKSHFKLEALLFLSSINFIYLILWLFNLLRRKQIPLQSEIYLPSTSSIPYCDRGNNEGGNPNCKVIDISQNDFTNRISPFILSSQRSSPLTKSTPVDAFTGKNS